MSVLDDVLKEEYGRLLRMKQSMLNERNKLPKGYISKKNIRGNKCSYLQYREGDKIKSFYLRESVVPEYTTKIEKRRSLDQSIKQIDAELRKIERTIG